MKLSKYHVSEMPIMAACLLENLKSKMLKLIPNVVNTVLGDLSHLIINVMDSH